MAGTPVVVERMWVETNNKPESLGPHIYDAVRIASRSVMLTKSRISTRGKMPTRPKYAIHLASETRLGVEQKSGSFQVGETVKGSESGATGILSLTQADPLFGDDFPIPAPYRSWLARPMKLMLREISGSVRSGFRFSSVWLETPGIGQISWIRLRLTKPLNLFAGLNQKTAMDILIAQLPRLCLIILWPDSSD